ncbi:MAG: N-acetylglucosamine-6-phosphate deacetylase [Proteobacteria bacterium]|nr:N-acetylglucosamine-6-phosphate deacetylase [Pseudomonadota bacterium]
MNTMIFRNAQVLAPRGFERGLDVRVDNGRITAVAPDIRADDAAIIDLEDGLLVPGFIDTQVNGGGDVLLNDTSTVAGVRRIAEAHRKFGTTGLMPTLISDDVSVMRAAIIAVHDAIEQKVPGVLGIHLEGPWLAEARKGVHDPHKFHTPDASELDLVASLGNGATMVTLAPERFAPEALHALAERGVLVCAGHTAATYEQLRDAFTAGVRGVTHLFNAMTPMGSRAPGGVGASIDDPDSWCGIIVDGYHVDDAPLRIAIAAKPRGKMMLVTDAMPPVGGEREDFTLYGIPMTCRDGRCATTEGALAGSALDMASAVRNTVQRLGLPLDEACRMASQYPAEFLRLGDELGKIAPGYLADLVWLDRDLNVRGTWIGGK